MASGTESAMIFDTLLATGRESEYRRQEGRAEAMTRLGAAVAAVAGGLLAGFFLRLPFYVNVLSGLANLAIVASLAEPPRTRLTGHAPLREILAITRESLRDRNLRPPMLLTAALMSTGIVAIWGYFLRLTDSGVALASYGVFFAIFQGSSAVAAVTADRIVRRIGRRAALATIGLVPASFLVLAVFPSPWALVLAPLGSFGWGLSTPLLLEVINRHVPSDRRATVLSVGGMVARVAFIVVAPLFGWLTDALSDRAAFAMLAVVTIAAGVATLPGLARDRPAA
jgi:MFS family permease